MKRSERRLDEEPGMNGSEESEDDTRFLLEMELKRKENRAVGEKGGFASDLTFPGGARGGGGVE